jgi:ribonucleoside-diphosphate reductase beta chain
MSIDIPPEQASLDSLQQTPVDRVLNSIDEGLTHLPSYRELYYRWERQQWSVQEIDFSQDCQQWATMSEEERRIRIYGLSTFFRGEERVTNTLAPYITAMPDDDMRIFLTTQLVDEARHTVFFERFFREVIGMEQEKLEEVLVVVEKNMRVDLCSILVDALGEVSDRIRREPAYLPHLLEGVVLYHLIVEAMMALSGQKNMLDVYRKKDIFPSFRAGFTAVVRDESRHVLFGVRFLRDMIQRDHANVNVILAAIQKYLPTALSAITPTQEQIPQILARGDDPWRSPRYGLSSLAKKLKVVGLSISLPTVPPPPFPV